MRLSCLACAALAPLILPEANARHLRKLQSTGKFYVDYGNNNRDSKCVQDCDVSLGPPCGGQPPAPSGFPPALFDTAEACCKDRLWWKDIDICVAETNEPSTQAQGSNQWYVDWDLNFGTCVQDCEGSLPCGGIAERWELTYSSAESCCEEAISWQPSDTCALKALPSPTNKPTQTDSPTAYPVDVPTQSPTIALPFIFDGIDDAESVFQGELDLLWDFPTDEFGEVVDLAGVNYHIFSAVGEYDYESYLKDRTPQDLIVEFELQSLSDDNYQYHVVTDGEQYDYVVNTTYFGDLHSVLVIAEVDGVFSRNSEPTDIHASAEDPVAQDDINVVGTFIPTANLTITLDNNTGVLFFEGLVTDYHTNLTAGDFVFGIASDEANFFLEVLDVIESSDDRVVLNTNTTQLEQVFESLDYQTSIAVSRPDKVVNTTANQRYRHLIDERRIHRKLFFKKAFKGVKKWVKKVVPKVTKVFKNVVGFIADKVVGVVKTVVDVVKFIATRELKKEYDLININVNYKWPIPASATRERQLQAASTSSLAAKLYVRSSVYARVKISFKKASKVEAGWVASYGADFDLDAQGAVDFTGRRRIWTGRKKTFVFFVIAVPVWFDVGPKVDFALSAKGPPNDNPTQLKFGAKGGAQAVAWAGTDGQGTKYVRPHLTPYFPYKAFYDGSEYVISAALEPAIEIRLYSGALSGDLGISAGVTLTTRSDDYNIDGTPFLALTQADIDFDFSVFVSMRSFFAPNWNPRGAIYSKSVPLIGLPGGEIYGGDHSCNQDAIIDNIYLRRTGNAGIISNGFAGEVTWYVEDEDWDTEKQTTYEVKLVKADYPGSLSPATGKIFAIVRPKYPYFLPVVYSAELDDIVSSVNVPCDGTNIDAPWWPDSSLGLCKRDCAVGESFGCEPKPAGSDTYDSLDECCQDQLLGAVDDKYCTSRSVGIYSNGWHVDWTSGVCAKDCDPVLNPNPIPATPSNTSDPDYWCHLLAMSDEDLFDLASSGPLGDYCKISAGGSGAACDYYVKGPTDSAGGNGIPLTTGGLGSGCVATGGSCYYQDPAYPLSKEERDSMCTTSAVSNAAAQLRYGIRNGYCMDSDYSATCASTNSYCKAPFNFAVTIHDTLEECCEEHFSWSSATPSTSPVSPGSVCQVNSLQSIGVEPKVITLGDSYSAGVGLYQLGNEYDVEEGGVVNITGVDKRITSRQKDDECWRETDDLVGTLYANQLNIPAVSYACKGATLESKHIITKVPFYPFANQIELMNFEHPIDAANGWQGSTILFTIGGNDVETFLGEDWPTLVARCILSSDCHSLVTNGVGNFNVVKQRLENAFSNLAELAHGARIRVLGYPRLFQPYNIPIIGSFSARSCPGVTGINVDEADYFDNTVDELNAIIAGAVNKVKTSNPALDIKFVWVDDYITKGSCRLWDREVNDKVCKTTSTDLCVGDGKNGFSHSSFHPSKAGYEKYADAFFASL